MLDKEKIIKWSDMNLNHLDISSNGFPVRHYETSPFPIDPVINGRLALWYGDVFSLCVDGITQTTNEALEYFSTGLTERTGPEYTQEVREELRSIRTGEARTAKSHPQLPCRHVIFTVGPKYSEKYKNAAETALFSCYNGVLQKALERSMTAVGIPPLHSSGKTHFPDELGAHVAMRTVRRFLEKGHAFPHLIVLTVSDPNLFMLYESLMVSYFPREASHEDFACVRLPAEIGDADGSPWWPDRRIRIFSNPADNPSMRDLDDDSSVRIFPELNRDFVMMKEDVDKERLLSDGRKRPHVQSMSERERHIAIEIETKEREARILRRARTEDLSMIARTGCLYRSGTDRLGRQVIVVIGKWFRPETMDLDKTFLYLVKLLDDINGPYTVIYFHARTEAENRPTFRWMRSVYDNMEYRFKKNLKSLCIVHPTLWTKILTWWFTTFMAPAIKPKIQNIAGLTEIFSVIEPSQLEIPALISEHDITLHGFAGVAYSLNHSKTNTPTAANTPAGMNSLSPTTVQTPFGI